MMMHHPVRDADLVKTDEEQPSMSDLIGLFRTIDNLEDKLFRMARRYYGSFPAVSWITHQNGGEHTHSGEVLSVSGFNLKSLTIRAVNAKTRKESDIRVRQLLWQENKKSA